MRDLDGTGSLHVCAEGDPGAIPVYAALEQDVVTKVRGLLEGIVAGPTLHTSHCSDCEPVMQEIRSVLALLSDKEEK
jgi:hypothetical protein